MKIGIYTRVSTEKQKEKGISLEDQKMRGIDFCLKNNYDYIVFEDGGLSGNLPIDKRPGLNLLIEKIYNKEIQGVFIVDWSRLSRNQNEGFLIKEILKKDSIRLFEPSGEIILTDDSTDLLYGIKILLSSYERKRISLNIKRNLETNVRNGKVGGGLLINYGYTKDENKMLIIDPIESEVVKLIYKLCIEGKGTRVISNYLNEHNIPTKRMNVKNSSMNVKGKKKSDFLWRDSVVYNILTNPIYKGERQYSGKTYFSPKIIDKEVFDLVQEILSRRKNFKDTTNKYFYLLKGLIRCLECESRFYGRKREDLSDNQYICSSQRYTKTFCGTRGININRLDDYVWNSILTLPNDLRNHISDEGGNKFSEENNKKLLILNNELKKLYRRKDKLLLLYTEKDIGFELIKKNLNEILTKTEKIKQTIRLINKTMDLTSNKNHIVDYINSIIKLKEGEVYNEENKQRIIRNLVTFIGIKWNKKSNIHFIWIEYKIDKMTEFLMRKNIKVKYKKSGWRFKEDGTDTKILFRRIYPDISKYPKIDMKKEIFGLRINDKDYIEDNPFDEK